jgi:hypothetical protein
MSTVAIELRVGMVPDASHRWCWHLFVASPASGRTILVSANNPNPHRAAAFLYLAGHRQNIRTVELIERREATSATPALWVFVATVELPHAEA